MKFHTSFKIQQKPTIAEIEMRVVTIGKNKFKYFIVKNLYQRAHVGEVDVHRAAVWKVGHHSIHKLTKARIGNNFCVNSRDRKVNIDT